MTDTKTLVSYSSDDLTTIFKKIEDLNTQMKLNLDMTIQREHVFDEKGARQEATIVFTGTLDPSMKNDFEKFQGEVQKMIDDSEHSVRYEVDFKERKKVLSLKEEEDLNKRIAQSHERHRERLSGITQPMVKLTSRRTYSSKDGEKFSGNLYIGGDCPADLKENFIKYYNEVAKPVPLEYERQNQAKLKNEPSRPVISCSICKANLDEKESYFTCHTCNRDNKFDVNICDGCVKKDTELANFSHGHTLVLIPKKNEIRSNVSKKSPSAMSLWREEEPLIREFERDFGSLSRSLMPEFDNFTRGWMSATEPLSRRFREFERIADRIDRSLRSSFRPSSILDEMMFPFESIAHTDML